VELDAIVHLARHATTGSLTMYRAYGTRIMAVHANYLALCVGLALIFPGCTRMSLVPTCGRADSCPCHLHILPRVSLPYILLLDRRHEAWVILFHESTLQHVRETTRREGHWQCYHSNTRDTVRLANGRIPSWCETNMDARSCDPVACYQHASHCSAAHTSTETSRRWFWTRRCSLQLVILHVDID
jgi:hypothetical protein